MDEFLSLADDLQLKGLAGSHNEHLETVEQLPQQPKISNIETNEKVFTMPNKVSNHSNNLNKSLQNYSESSYDIVPAEAEKMFMNEDMDNLKIKINSLMEKVSENDGEIKWRCTVCAKVIKGQRDMGRHIETHIEGVSYPCNLCGAVKRSSSSFNMHNTRYHRN